MYFRNRGHFCNYCRKVVGSKCARGTGYNHHLLNQVLWEVWDNQLDRADELVAYIKAFETCPKEKLFNNQIRALHRRFGLSS